MSSSPVKKFFFQVLSSFMGAWIAIVLAGIVAVVLCFAFIGSMFKNSAQKVTDNSVLRIELKGLLEEYEAPADFSLAAMLQEKENVQTVETLVAAINEAKRNDKVKCIYLDCYGIEGAPASLHAVREALQEYRKAGKKIYAYADYFSQGDYYIASVANEIALNPAGELQMRGLGGISLFYKDFFDKIGVEFQVVRVGKGKAAVEPYVNSEMSDVARSQALMLYSTLWKGLRDEMASSRTVTPAQIDTLISKDLISCRPAEFAREKKLVTELSYRHKFEEKIAKAAGIDENTLDNCVTPAQLAEQTDNVFGSSSDGNQVAVLYAVGGIDTDMNGGIKSAELVQQILELADDDDVKALVMRVNSPGGSAFGSEQIWEALQTFKEKKKPFYVSMGDYAASGGYYISSGADKIYADQFTITGSIGIFGLIPNINGLCQKLGLNPQMVATNPQAAFPNLYLPLNENQLGAMQAMVQNGYNLFVKRCAEGRKQSVAQIELIADGRPLAATTAKQLGLVDEIGSLNMAISAAAKSAKLKKYSIVRYPNEETTLDNLMKQLEEQQKLANLNPSDPQQLIDAASKVLYRVQGKGCIQAAMPRIQFTY